MNKPLFPHRIIGRRISKKAVTHALRSREASISLSRNSINWSTAPHPIESHLGTVLSTYLFSLQRRVAVPQCGPWSYQVCSERKSVGTRWRVPQVSLGGELRGGGAEVNLNWVVHPHILDEFTRFPNLLVLYGQFFVQIDSFRDLTRTSSHFGRIHSSVHFCTSSLKVAKYTLKSSHRSF